MRTSLGEQKICKLLNKAAVEYEREKMFKNFRSGFLRFDFFIPEKKCFIEYNGTQHYEYVKHFYKTKSEWTKAKERDRQKISYALAKGYKIYCIPYWELDSLTSAADLFSSRFLAKSKFHNDIIWREHCKI